MKTRVAALSDLPADKPRGASVNGFSLHANTAVPAHRRDQLE